MLCYLFTSLVTASQLMCSPQFNTDSKTPTEDTFFSQFSTVCVGWRGTASLKLIIDISNWFCCYAVHVPFSV